MALPVAPARYVEGHTQKKVFKCCSDYNKLTTLTHIIDKHICMKFMIG